MPNESKDPLLPFKSGRHFLQLPGPTNVPDRILAAMARPTIDHRGPAFQRLAKRILENIKSVFKTEDHAFIFPGSGSGGWEAAIANTLSPGDRALIFEQGFFASKWSDVCRGFGIDVDVRPWDLRRGLTTEAVRAALEEDKQGLIRAVMVVHNETSSGVTTDLRGFRDAIDDCGRDVLLMVDAVSSLAAMELRHDEWGIDVTVSGSQKGLMMPPGLSFNAVSARAMERQRSATLPRSYWDWTQMAAFNDDGFFPYTPATNLLYGLDEAMNMLEEEGMDQVFARHDRFAQATRRAAEVWGLANVAELEAESSSSVTALFAPDGVDANELRKVILDRFDMSLGAGLGALAGRAFRIGHLGDLNDLTLIGTLGGVEMGLSLASVPHAAGGAQAAMDFLTETLQ